MLKYINFTCIEKQDFTESELMLLTSFRIF